MAKFFYAVYTTFLFEILLRNIIQFANILRADWELRI